MGIQCLAIVLALLLSTGVANVTIQPFNRTQPTESSSPLISFAILRCEIFTNFELNTTTWVESRWNITTGAEVEFPGTSDHKYELSQGESTENDLETVLIVQNIIYSDAGVYTCRARDNRDPSNRGPWVEAQVHLQLLVELASIETEISTFDNATGVSLSCEMSLYLRPDEDLQWFRDGQSITSGSGRHSITYTDGSGEGQFGGTAIGFSRISTLVISQPQTTDSGTYTCAIRNTQHSQDIELAVESSGDHKTSLPGSPETPSATPTPATPSASMSTQSTTSSDAFVYIGSGVALFIIVVVLTATVLCIVVILFKKKGKAKKPAAVDPPEKEQAVIMTETNVAYERKPELIKGEAKDPAAGDDPVYEYIPEDSRADIVMLETNVAYDRKPGERQHHVRTGITTEANVAYDWKPEDSRAAIMLEANVAYETKPNGRQDSRADIMTETNVAYDRKPDFIKGEVKKPASVDHEYEFIREDSRTAIMTDANPAYD